MTLGLSLRHSIKQFECDLWSIHVKHQQKEAKRDGRYGSLPRRPQSSRRDSGLIHAAGVAGEADGRLGFHVAAPSRGMTPRKGAAKPATIDRVRSHHVVAEAAEAQPESAVAAGSTLRA